MEAASTLRALLKTSVACFSLHLAVEKAAEAVEITWYSKAHSLVKVTGLGGLASLLGCFGLGLAFLSTACGVAVGSGGAMMILKRQVQPVLHTGFTGLTILLGCGIGGALLGSALITLMVLGLRGLFVMGFTLSVGLLAISKQQKARVATATAMLSFLALTFMTMLLGVWLGMATAGYMVIDPSEAIIPCVSLAVTILLPAACLVSALAEKAFGNSSGGSFGSLVAVTGLLLGLGTGHHSRANPLFYETFFTVRSVVYIVEMLTGVVGAVLGAASVSFMEADGLSLWISIPAAVLLYKLHVDVPHIGLLGLTERCLGAGGEVGLLLGLAGASGISLGSAAASTGKPASLWPLVALVFGVESGAFYEDSLSVNHLVVSTALTLTLVLATGAETTSEQKSGNKVTLLLEAVLGFAALGVATMGAMVLGAAGLLTAALGSAGLYGVILAALIAVINNV